MREELDKLLCEKYPRMFKNRHAPMDQTCMCWGFAHDDGWFNIIDSLCACIENHVNWSRQQRARSLLFNRALRHAIKQDSITPLINYYTRGERNPMDWEIAKSTEILATQHFTPVLDRVDHVVVDQVKEKFGTLRFYYHGGDEVVDGMVRMAEMISGKTCEKCGRPGTQHCSHHWVHVYCDDCEAEYQRSKANEDY